MERNSAEKRFGEPEDVAGVVAFLASEKSRWINGIQIPANGGSSWICRAEVSKECVERQGFLRGQKFS